MPLSVVRRSRPAPPPRAGLHWSVRPNRVRRPFQPGTPSANTAEAQGHCGREVSALGTRHAGTGSLKLREACSNTMFTCSRDTPGNHSRNSSTVAPPSRFENRAETGTRVPRNTHAALTLWGCRSTAWQVVQSSIMNSAFHYDGCRVALLPDNPGRAESNLHACLRRQFRFIKRGRFRSHCVTEPHHPSVLH